MPQRGLHCAHVAVSAAPPRVQDESADAIGVGERQFLCHSAAKRPAEHVCALDLERVEEGCWRRGARTRYRVLEGRNVLVAVQDVVWVVSRLQLPEPLE